MVAIRNRGGLSQPPGALKKLGDAGDFGFQGRSIDSRQPARREADG